MNYMNKLSIKHQSYPKSTEIDEFEQNYAMSLSSL